MGNLRLAKEGGSHDSSMRGKKVGSRLSSGNVDGSRLSKEDGSLDGRCMVALAAQGTAKLMAHLMAAQLATLMAQSLAEKMAHTTAAQSATLMAQSSAKKMAHLMVDMQQRWRLRAQQR